MKTTAVIASLALLASQVDAHYIFQQLTVPSGAGAVYQWIRKNSNYNSPVTDLTSTDLRCNVGATGSGTDTVSVAAGSTVTFTLDTPVYHQGPISWYMTKSPSTAAADDGSGDWFKIKDVGPTFSGGQASWQLLGSYSATIPSCLAPGDYLLRIQSLAIHNPWPSGIPQFYTECGQITVTGSGNSVPSSPTCKIPGCFKDTDPGYTVNIYNGFTNYTVPGPAVWTCGGSSTPGGSNPGTGSGTTTVKSSAGPTTMKTSTTPPATSSKPATTTTPPSSGAGAPLYGQCGGQGWTGPTTCASGTCKASGQYYSQCLPS